MPSSRNEQILASQVNSLRDQVASLTSQLEAANARVEAMRDVNRTLAEENEDLRRRLGILE